MAIEKILNKRSNDVVTDGGVESPKKPTSSQLDNGEIAVNYHKGTERIFIKNDNEEIVDFISKEDIDTLLADKADSADLAEVATSGSYNDLSDKPTLDDLNVDTKLYALDNSNGDYITAVDALITQYTDIPISHDIEGAKLRVYRKTYDGTETGNATSTLIEPSVSEITYDDGTTFVAYQRGSTRYIGLKWNFFDNTGERYTNGNIEVTCEVAGVLKLYFYDCGMQENAYFKKNGQTTNVKLKNGVLSFDVEAGDVLTVSPTYTGYQWVGLVGMSITGKYPVSKFTNDAGYLTEDDVDDLEAYVNSLTQAGSSQFIADDYEVGDVTIETEMFDSVGTVPIKNIYIPYYSDSSITIEGETFTKAIRTEFIQGSTVDTLCTIEVHNPGSLIVYCAIGGSGSYYDYHLQTVFSSDDGTITDEVLKDIKVFDTEHLFTKFTVVVEKSGIIKFNAFTGGYTPIEGHGSASNILKIVYDAYGEGFKELTTALNNYNTASVAAPDNTLPITSSAVYNALQSYETKMTFTTESGGGTHIMTANANTYYTFTDVVSGFTITLPSGTAGTMCVFNFTTSSSFSGFNLPSGTIKKMKDFAIEPGKTYEVVALYDGAKWLITATEFE